MSENSQMRKSSIMRKRTDRFRTFAIIICSLVGVILLCLIYVLRVYHNSSVASQRIVFHSCSGNTTEIGIHITNIYIAKLVDDNNNSYKIIEPKQLTNENQSCYFPKISMDGKSIAFYEKENIGAVPRNIHSAIYTIQSDGNNCRCLSPDNEFDSNPVFTPDDNAIVFVSNRNSMLKSYTQCIGGPGFAIYSMKANGNGVKQLTFPNEHNGECDAAPAISPDGHYIVYMSNSGSSHTIKIMNIDGTRQRVLIDKYSFVYSPQFSANGKEVYFSYETTSQSKHSNIACVNLDGSGLRELPVVTRDNNIAFTPYGKRIIYMDEDLHYHTVQFDGKVRSKDYLKNIFDNQFSIFPISDINYYRGR